MRKRSFLIPAIVLGATLAWVGPLAAQSSLTEGFQSYGRQASVPGWVDTEVGSSTADTHGYFKTWADPVVPSPPPQVENLVFGSRSNATGGQGPMPWRTGVFSTRTLSTISLGDGVVFSGMLYRESAPAWTGFSFFSGYPQSDAYYLLAVTPNADGSGAVTFRLASHGAGFDAQPVDSGIACTPGQWYRFRIVGAPEGSAVRWRIRVWPDGQAEPSTFAIDAVDSSATALREGRVGFWISQQGEKYLDDLFVQNPGALQIAISESGEPFPDGRLFNRDVVPTFTVSGGSPPVETIATLDSVPFVSGTTVSTEGTHRLVVAATDALGRHEEVAVLFTIDKTPPVFTNLSPPDGALLGAVQATLTGATDAATVTVNGGSVAVIGGVFSAVVTLAEGANVVVLTGTDAAGNTGGVTIHWIADTMPPTVAIQTPPDGYVTAQTAVGVAGTVADASPMTVTVNGAPATVAGGTFTVSGVPLTDGANPIVAVATDAAGNTASAAVQVVVDRQPPSISVTESGVPLADGALFKRAVVVGILVTDAHLDTWSATLDGAPFSSGTTVSAEGAHFLSVTASDTVGSTAGRTLHFTIDTTPPALSDLVPADGAFLTEATTRVSGACGDASVVTVNGVAATLSGGGFHIDSFPLAEGPMTLVFVAVDEAGNEARVTYRVDVDTTPPTITITSPAAGAFLNFGAVAASGTVADANLRSVTLNATTATLGAEGTWSAGPLAATDGPLTLTAVATDAGNRTGQASVTVTVDTMPPGISVTNAGTSFAEGLLTNLTVTPVIAVTDATETTTSVRLNGAPFTSGTTVAEDGSYLLEVVATDAAANMTSITRNFRIDTRAPLLASLNPEPGAILAAMSVLVSGTCEDAVTVAVNGAAAMVGDGVFTRADVGLAEGANDLVLVATDAAGNSTTQTLTVTRDTIAPVVTISSPANELLTAIAQQTVTGTVTDANLRTVVVNGGAAATSGSDFTRASVPLTEGANLLTAIATDAAGNTGQTSVTVTLDTTGPEVAITSPATGSVLGRDRTDVEGSVADSHLQSVTVNGVTATFAAGRFTAAGVLLAAGTNTLTATATDSLGNAATATVEVTFDDRAPDIAITEPADGARLRTQPIVVRGTVEGGTGITVTVNGVLAQVTGGTFEAIDVPLNQGINILTARAANEGDKDGVATISVTFDDVAPTVERVVPADGTLDVPLATVVRLTFSEPLDPVTVRAASVRVERSADGVAVDGALALDGEHVTFVPEQSFAERTLFTVRVAASAADLAGNLLASAFAASFRTGATGPPDVPALDPLPGANCAASILVTGMSEPGLRVTVDGGAAAASALAGADGRFAVEVLLLADSVNILSVTATDSQGRSSAAAFAVVRADCTPPTVTDAALAGATLAVTFSEAMDSTTLTAGGSLRLAGDAGELAAAVALSADGTVATVTGTADLSQVPFRLTITTDARDLAGNGLGEEFTASFTPGGAAIVGEVFDDRVGRPLAGATATIVAANGHPLAEPRPITTAHTDGRFDLSGLAGELTISIAKAGYTQVDRTEYAEPGSVATMFDARLTPLVSTAAASDGAAHAEDSGLVIDLAPASVPPGSTLTVANLSAQGLPGLLPLGWSPTAALDLATADGGPVQGLLTASWPNGADLTGGETLTLARYDRTLGRWIAAGDADLSADATRIEATLSGAGAWVVLLADPDPFTPPSATLGQPLVGVAMPASDPITSATVVADPPAVLPEQTDTLTVTVTTSEPIPSGFPVQALVSETLTLVGGATVDVPSFLCDFVVQRLLGGEAGLVFTVRPSEEAASVALSIGYERVRVKRYPFEVRRGDLLPVTGGTIHGGGGFAITVPEGALAAPTPVTLSPLADPVDLPLALPSGTRFVSAVNLGLGQATLAISATLSWTYPADISLPSAQAQLYWIEVAEVGRRVLPRFAARATLDAATRTVASVTPDPDLPLAGLVRGGVWILVEATEPVAFGHGRVLDVGGAPLAGAIVTGASALVQIADGDGRYALPFPAAGSLVASLRPDTGNAGSAPLAGAAPGALVAADILLQVTAPRVLAIAPDPTQPLPLTASIVATLSEALDPQTVSVGSVSVTAAGSARAGTVTLSPSGTQVVWTPAEPLPSNVAVTYVLSGVYDRAGYALSPGSFTATFHTVDVTPPAGIDPLAIRVSIPANGVVTISGGPGSVCGDCVVIAIKNDAETVTTTAGSDGAFQLTIPASTADHLKIVIRKPNGTEFSFEPGVFRSADGRTAIVSTGAAEWITADGIHLRVPAGAFERPTTVTVGKLLEAGLPVAIPARSHFMGGMSLGFGGVVTRKRIDVAVPAPAGTDAAKQHFVIVPVTELGQTRYMVIDLARLDGSELTTAPQGSTAGAQPQSHAMLHFQVGGPHAMSLAGAQGTLPGISEGGPLGILELDDFFTFVHGLTGDANAFVLGAHLPFVWSANRSYEKNFFSIPIPVGAEYTLRSVDSVTGFTLFETLPFRIDGTPEVMELPTDVVQSTDHTGPRLIAVSPGRVVNFRAFRTSPGDGIRVAPKIEYTLTGGDPGDPTSELQLTVTGESDAVAPKAGVTLSNVSRTKEPARATAASGAFTLSLEARAGDEVSLVIGETDAPARPQITLEFAEALSAYTGIILESKDAEIPPAPDIQVDAKLESDLRTLTLTPVSELHRGITYELLLPAGSGIEDTAQNGLVSEIRVPLASRAFEPTLPAQVVGDVNDFARAGSLLFEATSRQGLLMYSAADPGNLGGAARVPCDTEVFGGEVLRGVTYDGYGRLVVVGGGGEDFGFLAVVRLVRAAGASGCGYEMVWENDPGHNDDPGHIAKQRIARPATNDISPLPPGVPRRVRLLADDKVDRFVVNATAARDQPPVELTVAGTDEDGDGKQDPATPLTVSGRVFIKVGEDEIGKRNHPIKVANLTSGASAVVYTEEGDGAFTVSVTASSGDRIEVSVNHAMLAFVAQQGHGIEVLDVNATDLEAEQTAYGADKRLLAQFDGIYPTGSYCTSGQCPEGFRCHSSVSGSNYCYVELCRSRAAPPPGSPSGTEGECDWAVTNLEEIVDLDVFLDEPAPEGLPEPPERRGHVLALVNHFGLAVFSLNFNDRSRPFGYDTAKPLGSLSGSGDYFASMEVVRNLQRPEPPEGAIEPCPELGRTPDLAFIAAGEKGFYVVDVSSLTRPVADAAGNPAPPIELPSAQWRWGTKGSAVRFGVDAVANLLYVSDGGEGIKLYDISNPCGSALDDDPRLLGSYNPGGNAITPLEVDPWLRIAYGAASDVAPQEGRVYTFSSAPPVYFVADTNHDGAWEPVIGTIPLGVPNPLKKAELERRAADPESPKVSYPPDVVRILAYVAGGAGEKLVVEMRGASELGLPVGKTPKEFPRGKSFVALERQSDDPAQDGFNRYLSPPIALVSDPRAQKRYHLRDEEDRAKPEGQDNLNACENCAVASSYNAELAELATEVPSGEGDARPTPLNRAFEQWAGETIHVRLAENDAAVASLIEDLSYLEGVALTEPAAVARAVRGELAPALEQPAVQSPSYFETEAGVAIDTNARGAQLGAMDLAVKGRGTDVTASRSYTSNAPHFGALGRNWDSPLLTRLRVLPTNDVEYYAGDGSRHTFRYVGGEGESNSAARYEAPAGVLLDLYRRTGGRYTLVTPDRTILEFSRTGRLDRLLDRNVTQADLSDGNVMSFLYEGGSRLVGIIDPTDRRYDLEYYEDDAQGTGEYPGLLAKFKDYDNREVTYDYDAEGRLEKVEGPDPGDDGGETPKTTVAWNDASGGALEFELFKAAELTSLVDGVDSGRTVFTITYEAEEPGVVDKIAYGGGTWNLDPGGETTTVTDPLGHTTDYTHNERGQATTIQEADGSLTTFAYQPQEGLLESITRPLGDTVTYSYQSASGTKRPLGNVITVTENPRTDSTEAVRETTIVYDNHSLPTTVSVLGGTLPDGTTITTTTEIDRDERGNPSTITDAASIVTTLQFNNYGQIKEVDDPRTGTRTYTYEDEPGVTKDYLKTVSTPSGTTTYEEIDNRGNVKMVEDPSGNTVEYKYSNLDQLVSEIRRAATPEENADSETTMTYDAAGNLKSRDVVATRGDTPQSSHTDYNIDELGRLEDRTEDLAFTDYDYDPDGNLTQVARPDSAAADYTYDGRHRVESVTVDAKSTSYIYDENSVRTSSTNARQETTTFLINGFNETVGSIDPTDVTTENETDEAGRPIDTKVTHGDLLHKWSTRTYDPLGRVRQEVAKLFSSPVAVSSLPPDGGNPEGVTDLVTETVYDDVTRTTTIIDPRGLRTVAQNDLQGRPWKTTDPAGNVVELLYEANGNKKSETVTEAGGDSFTTTYTYDLKNRLETVTSPGNALAYEYDLRGNKTKETDAEGHVTRWEYDLKGRKTAEIDPNCDPTCGRTEWTYDLAGRVKTMKDAEGGTTQYFYDFEDDPTRAPQGNLTKEVRADGATWRFTYDENNNRQTATDANGTTVTYAYDDADRLTGKTIAKAYGVLGAASVSFTLDSIGRVVGCATDEGVIENFTYDSLDRQLSEELRIAGGPQYSVERSYDVTGGMTGLSTLSGLDLRYVIDPLGRIRSINEQGSQTPLVTYTDIGMRPTGKSLVNGITQSWSYDDIRRYLAGIEDTLAAVAVRHVTYDRTLTGNKRSVNRPDLGLKNTYLYNPNSWITEEKLKLPLVDQGTPEVATTYSIDKVLNYFEVSRNDISEDRAINSRNQYTAIAGTSLAYDQNGNLTSYATGEFAYDGENHLAKATLADGTTVENLYDSHGRKVQEKLVLPAPQASRTTQYVLSGDQVVEEYVNGALSARYVRGRGIDELVRVEQSSAGDGNLDRTIFPVQDELGTIERLTDANGATLERYEYEGYGKVRIFAPDNTPRSISAYGWKWLFQGREYQPQLGAYDFRARTLWPELGRFGQEDPAGTTDSTNLNQALGGNWIRASDPFGLELIDSAVAGNVAYSYYKRELQRTERGQALLRAIEDSPARLTVIFEQPTGKDAIGSVEDYVYKVRGLHTVHVVSATLRLRPNFLEHGYIDGPLPTEKYPFGTTIRDRRERAFYLFAHELAHFEMQVLDSEITRKAKLAADVGFVLGHFHGRGEQKYAEFNEMFPELYPFVEGRNLASEHYADDVGKTALLQRRELTPKLDRPW